MATKITSPPYPPTTASLGGGPTVSLDVPICAVFIALFVCGAVSHMTILQVNLRRGHKFILSGVMFGFCMARIVTLIMRIVSATRPRDLKIAIAAAVFVYAGVVLLFVVNLIFTQRIIRACHPAIGWHPGFYYSFAAIYVLIVITLVMLLTASVQTIYTANLNTRRIDRDIILYGQTFYAVVSFIPVIMIVAALVIPRKTRTDKFGQGRFQTKIAILLTTSLLLCLGASFRTGTNYAGGTRPIRHPAGYQSKACFYIFNFVIEITVTLLYVVVRIDRRFWVPNKSKKPGDYSRGRDIEAHKHGHNGAKVGGQDGIADMITTEEETFDEKPRGEIISNSNSHSDTYNKHTIHADEEKAVQAERQKLDPKAEDIIPTGKETAVDGDMSNTAPLQNDHAVSEIKGV